MDGRQLPFPEDLPINRETLLQFSAAFLAGHLQRSVDARKAMITARSFSSHNTVFRKEKREAHVEIRGVSEQLTPQDAVVQVTCTHSSKFAKGNAPRIYLWFTWPWSRVMWTH